MEAQDSGIMGSFNKGLDNVKGFIRKASMDLSVGLDNLKESKVEEKNGEEAKANEMEQP